MSDKSDKRSKDYDPALDPAVADHDLTADQYLRRQGERAKAAIMGTTDAMKDTVTHKGPALLPAFARQKLGLGGDGSGSPSPAGDGDGEGAVDSAVNVLREHPWYTVGAATAVGFLGAVYFDPTRFGSLKRKLNKLEKRLKKQEEALKESEGEPATKAEHKQAAQSTAAKTSLFASLGTFMMSELVKQAKPLVTNLVAPIINGEARPGGAAEHLSPEMMAALRERFGGHMPPGNAGDPQI